MKKKTVYSVMTVVMLLAISLYFIGGTYARYVSEFEGNGKVDIAKWAVKLKNGEQEVAEESFDLQLKAEENQNVVTGKIAPSVTATGDLEVELNGTEVSVDVISAISETAIQEALSSMGVSVSNSDITSSVTVTADETASNIKEITGTGTKDAPYVVALKSNTSGFGETDKIKISVKVTWTNVDTHSEDHTKIGEKAQESATLTVPLKLQIVQHIENQKYTPGP